jgi:hippurate hydrolase
MFSQEEVQHAIAIRHDLHAHPELRYEEHRTADIVATELEGLGYEVQRGVAKTGVVALLHGAQEGPCIAFRADMDALPIAEKTGLAYASKHQGKMHACGHDGHTATLLLAARYFAKHKDAFKGTIKLLFQPAEEGGNGAELMVKEGVLENPRVEAIFGYHNRPGYPAKQILLRPNSAMGSNDSYELTIYGKAGHSAMPHLAIDPIYIGANIVQQTQGLVGRGKSPLKHGVITVSTFHAGTASNIIPETAKLTINIRSDSAETRQQLSGRIEALIKANCEVFGAKYHLEHINHMPALINPPEQVNEVQQALNKYLPEHDVVTLDYMPTMGAEDFSFYLEKVPGCFLFVGLGEDVPYLHNEMYNFNDEILDTAASAFVAIAKHYLAID